MTTSPALYHYRGTVTAVVDGDTLDITFDLGFRMTTKQRFRLYGVDAPERFTATGPAATEYVKEWLEQARLADLQIGGGGDVFLRTHKPVIDKYGRWLAEVFSADGRSLTDDMIAAGHAVRWFGQGA